jgi:hypothetical protein
LVEKQRVISGKLPHIMRRQLCAEIARPRVLDSLAWSDLAPVRMLCAPHGGGKTTALLQYAALHHDVLVATLPPQASRSQVMAELAKCSGARITVVDQADGASPAGTDALFEEIDTHWPDGRRYLMSGSSRTRMRLQPLAAQGIATIIDASVFSFDSTEIGALADAQGVATTEFDVEQLKYDTDGWPVAVSWVIRDAARNGRPLRGAFEQWRVLYGHLLLELVTGEYGDARSSEAFIDAIQSIDDPKSQRALERLDAAGYPIVRMRASLRPYRVLMQIAGAAPAAERAPPGGQLNLRLFGRFSCRIAGQPVAFDRRRDQNVLTYIALSPGATVTRAELLLTFWPDASRAVASQGLRTTLCRLRRALANAAGCDAGLYVFVGNSIALDLSRVSVDARAFRDCAELAETEDANGNVSAAREHYAAAEHLYLGALLASEAPEPQLSAHMAEYSELFKHVRARAGALAATAATSTRVRGDLRA